MTLPPSSRAAAWRYGLAIVLPLAAALAVQALGNIIPPRPLLWFTLTIALAAWWGGFGPGVVTTVLCGLVVTKFFLEPVGRLEISDRSDLQRLIAFTLAGLAISALAGALHRALRRERLQTEALRTSEERLRLAVQATEDAVWDWDIADNTLGWSPAVAMRFGWPEAPPRTSAKWWEQRIHPDDRERVLKSIHAVIADPTGDRWQAEYRFERGDGTLADVLDRGSVLRDSNGRAVRMIGAMLYLTKHKQAESALRRSREELQVVIDNVHALISYVDRDFIYRWNSRGYGRWFNRPLDQITGRSMRSILGEAAFALIRPRLERALAGETVEYEDSMPYEGMAGRWVHAICAPHYDGAIVRGIVISVTDISELRKAEQSNAALAAIVENSDDAIIGETLDGIVTSWNRAAARLFGYSATEMIGQSMRRLHPPDQAEEKARVLSSLGRGEKLEQYEARRVTSDGRLIDVAVTNSPIHDRNGKIVGVSTIARDISGRKRDQEAIRESEQRWRQLAGAMPHLVWSCRADGACDFVGGQWVSYTGRPAEEHLNFGWLRAVHPADRELAAAAWNRAVMSGGPYDLQMRIRRFDGEHRWFNVRAVPVHDAAGRIVKWYGSNTDIEDLKRAEASAMEAAEQRRLAVEAAGMGAWDWNVKTGALAWSERAFVLFGVPPGEVPSYERFIAAIHPEDRDRVKAALATALAHPPHRYQCEYRVVRPDGSVRWLFGKGAAQIDPISGEPVRMIGITVDVTERVLGAKELEAALEAAQAANRAKDAFLASLSHELRTPLTPVLFLAASLERSDEVPGSLRQDFAMIRRNIELEARLIDDLLDLTRITRGKLHLDLAPAGLHSVLRRSLELLHEDLAAKKFDLDVDLAAERDHASADPVRLQQVFWNILKNAVKFTPEGGRISVRSRCSHLHAWHVTISDSGLGITEAELPLIFEAFAQGGEASSHRFGGLGLGLAISSLLVREHGGRIWAESAGRNRGATFHIELPLLAGDLESDAADDPATGPPAGTSGRILIVEDHEPTRQTLERLLMRRGYEVKIAENAGRARALAAAGSFDLMISDLGLPDGTGHELAVEFGGAYGLKAIALSGYGMEEDVRRSRHAGFLDHLTKPVNIEALNDAIIRALKTET